MRISEIRDNREYVKVRIKNRQMDQNRSQYNETGVKQCFTISMPR